jgi:hypothetical protein
MNTIASSRINLQFDKKFDGYKAIQNLSEKVKIVIFESDSLQIESLIFTS